MLAKSKAEKRKQKRKKKQVQVKRAKVGQAAADKGWFYYREAHYYHDTENFSQALKFIKKAVKFLPKEEEVLCFMGQIGELADDSQVKLDALDGLEKIGKITDMMRYNRVILLVNMGKYERCLKTAEALLQNFTQLKLDDKRQKKSDIKNIIAYCEERITQARVREKSIRLMDEFHSRQKGLAGADAKAPADMADALPQTPEPSTVEPVKVKAPEKTGIGPCDREH